MLQPPEPYLGKAMAFYDIEPDTIVDEATVEKVCKLGWALRNAEKRMTGHQHPPRPIGECLKDMEFPKRGKPDA